MPWLRDHNPAVDWVQRSLEVGGVTLRPPAVQYRDVCMSAETSVVSADDSPVQQCAAPASNMVCESVSRPLPHPSLRVGLVVAAPALDRYPPPAVSAPVPPRSSQHPSLLSRHQLVKEVRQGAEPFLLFLQHTTDPSSTDRPDEPDMDPAAQRVAIPLLDSYADVFPADLPAGLPPQREVDHRIELEPGAVPPSRPTYRLSPSELDELRKQLADLTAHGFIEPSKSPVRCTGTVRQEEGW